MYKPDRLLNIHLSLQFVNYILVCENPTCVLYKHVSVRFFPVMIIFMGTFTPLTSGAMSSAAIAFVYRASSLKMMPGYAVIWGVGQTLLGAAVGFTRILATL